MTFGQKLSALRRGRGYSQEQLAEAIHVSRQAVSKWESEAAMPDTDNVLQLSRLFGVSTDYLLREDWEEDRPLSAGASQGKGVEQEEHWPLTMMLLVAAEALALFWQLMGSLVYQNHLIPLLGMTVHILAIVCFEAIFQRHRREDGAREGDGREERGPGVRGAADDLAGRFLPDVDAQKVEMVAIGDLFAGQYPSDDDLGRARKGGEGIDLGPGLREGVGDLLVACLL